jgi:hypothetical protein
VINPEPKKERRIAIRAFQRVDEGLDKLNLAILKFNAISKEFRIYAQPPREDYHRNYDFIEYSIMHRLKYLKESLELLNLTIKDIQLGLDRVYGEPIEEESL